MSFDGEGSPRQSVTLLREQLKPMLGRIAQRWVELIFATYPDDATGFLSREHDPFANPVGFQIRQATSTLLEELVTGRTQRTSEALDWIVRIRSVQDFSASGAVSFIFLLKQAVTDVAGPRIAEADTRSWLELDESIDGLAMEAFDIYMKCREKLFTIRLAERDRWNASILLRARREREAGTAGRNTANRKENPKR